MQSKPQPAPRHHRWPPGTPLLALATLVAAPSLALALPLTNVVYCDRLAPLAVLAALAAVLIALCFRTLAAASRRTVPAVALLLAGVSLFAALAFIVRYHAVCGQLQQQVRQQARRRVP